MELSGSRLRCPIVLTNRGRGLTYICKAWFSESISNGLRREAAPWVRPVCGARGLPAKWLISILATSVVALALLSVLSPSALASSPVASTSSASTYVASSRVTSSPLMVHFIDVGQGDSILIQSPAGENVLIDAGEDSAAETVIGYLETHGVRHLDYVVATHPHSDHIGGLDDVIRAFDVSRVYMPRRSHTTSTFEQLLLAISEKGLKITEARAGVRLPVSDVDAEFLGPSGDEWEDLNNYSAVLMIRYGDTAFLLMGDAEEDAERAVMAYSPEIHADLLKAGHHGSNTSSSSQFLDAVSPAFAVVSVGEGNPFGHPSAKVIGRLADRGVEVYRTDLCGTIVAVSDGKTVTLTTERQGPDYATGEGKIGGEGSAGAVAIESVDLEAEVVVLSNLGDDDVDLTGWRLVSLEGDQSFVFPTGTVIGAHSKLKVVCGKNAEPGPDAILWTRSYIWSNSGDEAVLYDADGHEVGRL